MEKGEQCGHGAEVLFLERLPNKTVSVMAGLDPAIHVLLEDFLHDKTCMPGTRPGMMDKLTPTISS
jgi:hypothetical protein